uniref:Out at first protein homolog n=1 Tax=Branchiostoma floridae TaxID=7739 RepID=C3Z281_BRAFL|eukprot:XP_002597120.1 hypothetical protein BRAFLDRAFT_121307 [Branchiostoma floridae]
MEPLGYCKFSYFLQDLSIPGTMVYTYNMYIVYAYIKPLGYKKQQGSMHVELIRHGDISSFDLNKNSWVFALLSLKDFPVITPKNPGTIRNAEDDKGQEHLVMDMGVDLEKSAVISRHIYNICAEAGAATYTRETDLKYLAKGDNKTLTTLLQATRRLTPSRAVRCMDSSDWLKPCTCQLEICIGWYPCGLKYCRGKDGNGKVINYRCGIKTCRKCRQFDYHVKQKQLLEDLYSPTVI